MKIETLILFEHGSKTEVKRELLAIRYLMTCVNVYVILKGNNSTASFTNIQTPINFFIFFLHQ